MADTPVTTVPSRRARRVLTAFSTIMVLASTVVVSLPGVAFAATSSDAFVDDEGGGTLTDGDRIVLVFDAAVTVSSGATIQVDETPLDDTDDAAGQATITLDNAACPADNTAQFAGSGTTTITVTLCGNSTDGTAAIDLPATVEATTGFTTWDLASTDVVLDDEAPRTTSASIVDTDASNTVTDGDVMTLVFGDVVIASADDTFTLTDPDNDTCVITLEAADSDTPNQGTFGVSVSGDTLTVVMSADSDSSDGSAPCDLSVDVTAVSVGGIEDRANNDWAVSSGDVTFDDPTDPVIQSSALTSDANGDGAWNAVDDVLTVGWSEVVTHIPGATPTASEVSAMLGTTVTFGSGGSTVVTIAGSGTLATWTLTISGEALDGGGLFVGQSTPGQANVNVDDRTDNTQVAVGGLPPSIQSGPVLTSVNLSSDTDGDQLWDAVNDVLQVTWDQAADHVAGDGALTVTQVNDILGTGIAGGAITLVGADANSDTWSLRITTALSTGLDASFDTNTPTAGTNNGDVTGEANGLPQVETAFVTATSNWPSCGTVGGVSVTTRCIDTFTPSTNLDLQVFEASGLLQVQVHDTRRNDSNELIAEGDAIGGGTVTGPLTASSNVQIGLALDTIDPTVLIGTGDLVSYTISSAGASAHTLDMTVQPEDFAFKTGCSSGGGCSGNADIDYEGSLSFAVVPGSVLGDPSWAAAFRGSWIMTDAQEFGFPFWTGDALEIVLAGPSNLNSGAPNDGFFNAFLAPGLFGPSFFNIDPADATFTATKNGTTIPIGGATPQSGGVSIQLNGFGYSTPTIAIKAVAPSSSGGGGGGGGGGSGSVTTPDDTVTETVTDGGTVSTAPAGGGATSDKPTQTAVTSPVGGTVSIQQKQTTTTQLASGQTALNVEVDITAPDATPEEPLVLDFELDSSLLENVDLDRLVVYRNGEPVPACTDPSAAVPDPCVAASESQDDGDLDLTVRTSQASTWNFGVVDSACPGGFVTAGGFGDVAAGSTHASSIDCAAWWGVVEGQTADAYAPSDGLTRGQAASAILGLLEAVGIDLPDAGDAFSDDDPVHGESAEVLAAAGIVSGVDGTRYDPAGTVSRAHMAKLLVGAYEFVSGEAVVVSDGDPFTDDDASVLADEIAKAAAAGLTSGVTATTFAPDDPVSREQLASFLVNLLETLVVDDLADPPLR